MGTNSGERDFDAVFDAHYADVLAFAIRRTEGRASAEDVVSETFAVAWRKRKEIPAEPLGWLYAVARRLLANERRGARRRGRLMTVLSRERSTAAHSGDQTSLVDEHDHALQAFSRLTEGEREVLLIVAWEGADVRTGSETLGCTPTAFRVRLHRARRALERETSAVGARDPAEVSAVPQPAKETR